MNVEYIHFPKREVRSNYIARRFKKYLEDRTVLDVGCDQALLKDLVETKRYTGIDIGGNPDICINLEKVERLPFDENAFDTIVCSDVLEHIENLHQIFDELLRVAKHYVILSLPNNWCCARRPIEKGKGSFSHYGLPVDPVEDRHKWFFSLSDAQTFLKEQEKKKGFKILELFATEKKRSPLVKMLRVAKHPAQEAYLNRYSNTLWTVLRL